MTRDARFEIVRTNAGHHARFIAANGRTVWTTEVYTRRRAAVEAVELLLDATIRKSVFADHPEIHRGPFRLTTEVRDVDERGDETATETALARVRALAEDHIARLDVHKHLTLAGLPDDHRPCEHAARARFAEDILAALDGDA